jgi:hypothetical protein
MLGVGALTVQGVRGDHGPVQVGQGVEHGREGGQLVGVAHLGLGQHQTVSVVEDRDQLGLAIPRGSLPHP